MKRFIEPLLRRALSHFTRFSRVLTQPRPTAGVRGARGANQKRPESPSSTERERLSSLWTPKFRQTDVVLAIAHLDALTRPLLYRCPQFQPFANLAFLAPDLCRSRAAVAPRGDAASLPPAGRQDRYPVPAFSAYC